MTITPRSLLLLFVVLVLTACHRQRETAAFPNAPVILISIDTLRADRLPSYGYRGVATPAFDQLAADGILFENAYAHVPLTLPSHASMLTGRLPYETGVRSNLGYRLTSHGKQSLPHLLATRGYATGGAVSAYVLNADTGIGPLFQSYDDSLEVWESATLGSLQRRGDETSAAALRWIDSLREKPFFLFLHLFEPHTPYEPVEPFRSRYANAYDGEIATVDAIVGRFLDELRGRGLYDDALIVLTADHGEGLGDHGEAEHGVLLYREALHVPLIVKLPEQRLAGRRVAAPVQHVDLLPTLAGAVGAEIPVGMPGVSLIALAEGAGPAERTIYGETLYPRLHLGWSELRSLTDARHQYIESPEPELFDVSSDPRQTRNLREERRRVAHALAGQLSRVPLNLTEAGAADPEERARLAALGYLSGASTVNDGPRRNPRDHIEVLGRIQQTFALNQQGRYRESIALCREILRDYPDLVDVYNQLAGNLRRLGRLKEALEMYRAAIRRSPQLVDSMAIEVAKLELDLGNFEAAELNARQAMKLNPNEAHLILAGIAAERGQWPAAERETRLALGREDRPRVPALILLARVLAQQGKLQEALATIERARTRVDTEGAPAVATLASTRGDILARMGRTREAEAAFREEIARFPTSTNTYVLLAVLLASERRFSEIGPTLEAMVTASPTPETYGLAARAMADLGNDRSARHYRARGEQLAMSMRDRQTTSDTHNR